MPALAPTFLFGLHWFALIQGPSGPAFRHLQRRQKPLHHCFSGHTFYSVGLWHHRFSRRNPSYSAAACLAAAHPNDSLLFLLPYAQQWWVVALHEGAVVSGTDRLYDERALALQHIQQLQQSYPHSRFIQEVPEQQPLLDWLQTLVQEKAQMLVSRSWLWPTSFVGIGALACILFWQGLAPTEHVPAPEQADLSAQQAQLEHAHGLTGVAGLKLLLDSLGALPLSPGGWELQQAQCVYQEPAWRCHANYGRQGPSATNQSLQADTPVHMRLVFASLDSAQWHWSEALQGQTLSPERLLMIKRNQTELFSRIQTVQSAFTALSLSASQTLSPELQEQTLPYRLRYWHSAGPLRSYYVLLPWVQSFRWQRAQLQRHAQLPPALRSSVFSLTLEGQLYELVDEPIFTQQTGFTYRFLADDGAVPSA